MEKLMANFSEIDSVSKGVSEKNIEFIKLIDQINKINSDLKLYWEGQDASKYSSSVEIQIKNMKDLSETIEYTANYLSFVSNTFQETMKDNTSMFE